MRVWILAFALALVVLTAGVAAAEELATTPEKIVVKTIIVPGEIRDYMVDVRIKGNVPSSDTGKSMDLDTGLSLKVRFSYGRREGDGLLPVEMSLVEGDVTSQGQKLSISPGIYPKLTLLLDSNLRIDDVFGVTNIATSSVPGINYSNIGMLFYLVGADKPHAIGEQWESRVALAGLKEAYDFTNTIKSVDTVDGIRRVTVRQDIRSAPAKDSAAPLPGMTAVVDSVFSTETGKLMKSHVECMVTIGKKNGDNKQQDQPTGRANIKMDITLIK